MKTNLPVSGRAVEFSANANILSTTNPKGAITYVNPDFINISGFSELNCSASIINIVRHPDMPPEAFAHMWQTLKDGRSWMGLVKIAARTVTTTGSAPTSRRCSAMAKQ